ncbi:hypothetical protein HNP84_006847 [Thermocatellispora tengchongensis]|uniref:Uncharacterized protein n=1 Tax=Thermocatellispora tengchongensis TaxID=1073253 RepID=A0A840PM24_9ACTN|nr:hypothetical protein [Thermocatellispora tengchongensis]
MAVFHLGVFPGVAAWAGDRPPPPAAGAAACGRPIVCT